MKAPLVGLFILWLQHVHGIVCFQFFYQVLQVFSVGVPVSPIGYIVTNPGSVFGDASTFVYFSYEALFGFG
jgi:hypothetical protein